MSKVIKFNTLKLGSILDVESLSGVEDVLINTVHDAVLNGADENHIIELTLNTVRVVDKYNLEVYTIISGLNVDQESYNKSLYDEENNTLLCYIYNFETKSGDLCYIEFKDSHVYSYLEQKFEMMLKSQHELNKKTSGNNYIHTGVNINNNKLIDFDLDMKMELSELINTLPYKHWKNGVYTLDNKDINHNNLKVELIDMLHFNISKMLEVGYYVYLRENDNNDNNDNFEDIDIYNLLKKNIDFKTLVISNINILLQIEKSDVNDIPDLFMYMLSLWFKSETELMTDFSKILLSCMFLEKMYNFSIKDMVNLYIGKNTLNHFRIDNGYRENTYVKNWLNLDKPETEDYITKEDNDFMLEYVNELSNKDELSYDNLYKLLEEKYKEVLEESKPMEAK